MLGAILALTTYILQPLIPAVYLIYLQLGEVIVVGYFIIQIFSTISYKLTLTHSAPTANSIKSLVRIVGGIIVIAFIISYLSQNPVIAASISTISGLVIGFASSNLIGNVIAGLYLAITRPFRIGDRIMVFGQNGTVKDISLLYTRLILDISQDEMLASNSSMVTTWLVLVRSPRDGAAIKTV
jgi:small-conductance mechanosensitive channel